jgi:UDP-2,4-diacetamido-2,4,6-trideoxy-beta-L-altropyranose hydrolase
METTVNRKIVLRANCSKSIGNGHLNRLLSLAYILKNDFEIIFVTNDTSNIIKKMILSVCNEVNNLPLFENNLDEIKYIRENVLQGNEIIVLDGYQFSTDYQKEIKNYCSKLVCIDDEAQNHFVADLVINHAPGVYPEDYKKENYTKLCLGLNYLMLRQSFLSQKQPLKLNTKIETLFICFGGSDNHDYSKKITEIVIKISEVKKIILITGPHYTIVDNWIEKLQIIHKKLISFKDLSEAEMSHQMLLSDVLLVPASTMSLEALALDKIVLTGITASNQKKLHDGILPLDQVFSIGDFKNLTSKKLNSKIQSIFHKRKEDIPKVTLKPNHFLLKEFKLL